MAAAALTLAAPFALAQPAHAEDEQASLTFVNSQGVPVTCYLFARNVDADPYQVSGRSDVGPSPECNGEHEMAVAYKDQEGDEHTFSTYTPSSHLLSVHVEGHDVRIAHRVTFTGCDLSQSATCSLTLLTSTK